MAITKVVLIGAASASFGPAMIGDALLSDELRGSTLVLVDIDHERLDVMAGFAHRLNASLEAGWHIEQTTERCEALSGAAFVIVSVAVLRDELWKQDFAIPIKHGIRQVLGENGGPGGWSHSLRNIPLLLGIAKDMERLCPQALLLNFTNPESRLSLAISRYTAQPFVGLCFGVTMGFESISRITGIPQDDLDGTYGGLNHLGWFTAIHRRSTGEDVYPLLRTQERRCDPEYLPLTRYLLRTFGLYPYPSDDHIAEYLSYGWEFCGLDGYHFAEADRHRAEQWAWISRVASGTEPPPARPIASLAEDGSPVDPRRVARLSPEFAWTIINAIVLGRPASIPAVNVRNEGLIPNLPPWAIVEVPGVAGPDGVHGVPIGPLPGGIAALCNTQAAVQDLTVEAAVHGSRELALQALLADPVVQNTHAAEQTLDELLSIHAPYLPTFR
ncbi:MAG: alpha-glucosidase/alpha-galactosidase [Herpetosiphonaceae bacterium]|nr:alpha-glucosidase/alpha-galactosidase [Herpetosiphonaceae bacterium]